MHKGLLHDDPLRDRAMTRGDRSLLSSAAEWNRNEGQMTPSELEQEMNRQRAMAGDPGHASIGPPESRMSSIWGHLRHGIPRRVERFLEPETPAEMAGLLGASMYPGVGEAIDVADFAAGFRDRDLPRMGWAAGGAMLPLIAGSTLRKVGQGVAKKWLNATGDVVTGDTVRFKEGVFGPGRKPKYLGERTVTARIIGDSYGGKKQQHTFSLEVLDSDGFRPLDSGVKTRRKGRNVYRHGTERLEWANEQTRKAAADEKHGRGDIARSQRDQRRAEERGI